MQEDKKLPTFALGAAKSAAPFSLVFRSGNKRITHANEAAAQFFDLNLETLLETKFTDLVDELQSLPFVEDSVICNALMKVNEGWSYPVRLWLDYQSDRSEICARWEVSNPASPRPALDVSGLLRAAIEVLPEGFVLYDRQDRLVLCNEQYRKFYNRSAAAIVPGEKFENILRFGLKNGEYPQAAGREEAWLEERLQAHKNADSTIEQKQGDGRWLRIIERRTPDGGRVGLRIDITAQIESRTRAEQAEQRLNDAIQASPAGFSLFDEDDRLLIANERFLQMFATKESKIEIGQSYTEILTIGMKHGLLPEAQGNKKAWLAQRNALRKQAHYEAEYELKNGNWFRALNRRTSENGMVGFQIDITELKKRQIELERMSSTDSLTGIANRRGVWAYLKATSRRLAENERLVFLHIDLDRFKSINDVIGHNAGDFVLKEVSKILQKNVRKSDLVARVGGDEFLIALRTKISADAAMKFAVRLRKQLSEPFKFRGRLCHVGASIGISVWVDGEQISLEQALLDADTALNDCKSRGRHRCTLFHEKMRQSTIENAKLAQEISDGILANEFEPWFQPQTDITGKHVDGFEVLARWDHSSRGLMTAASFVNAAEDAGIMAGVDRQILEKTLRFVHSLSETKWRDLKFSLNLSSAQLSDPDIVDYFLAQLSKFETPTSKIRIEILESVLLDERSANVIENIRRFADEGFSIELDDFGTGHTAIASLVKFPVERIKIDRSLVRNIHKVEHLKVVTDAIASLGLKLGLKVLAEGVETEDERKILEDIGCTCLQGYMIAKPMPQDAVIDWLNAKSSNAQDDSSSN